jgi:hypothetical protein
MTDTSVDGQVQRVQAMLYANRETISPRAGRGESRISGSAVEVWGNTSVEKLKGAPCSYHNQDAAEVKVKHRYVLYTFGDGSQIC